MRFINGRKGQRMPFILKNIHRVVQYEMYYEYDFEIDS